MPYVIAFILALTMTPAIAKMAGGFNSPIKDELMVTQSGKAGTCSLGSVAIILSTGVAALVSGDMEAIRLVALAIPFFIIGLADDIMKIVHDSGDGFPSLVKLALQLVACALDAYIVKGIAFQTTDVLVYYPCAILFIATTVNALNITDGLDGLAAKVSIPPVLLAAIALPSLRSGNLILLMVLAGYLVYNTGRASIFMGDGGSHFIGAFLAMDALLSLHPVAIAFSAAVIYVELLSSFIQIVSIRCFSRKVFLIAPLHHDFEQRGYAEGKIVDTFFSVTVFTSLVSAIVFFRVV